MHRGFVKCGTWLRQNWAECLAVTDPTWLPLSSFQTQRQAMDHEEMTPLLDAVGASTSASASSSWIDPRLNVAPLTPQVGDMDMDMEVPGEESERQAK
eukprot:6333273-Amphidinium_carterae.1